MWSPDEQPEFGFEQLAQRFGVHRARRIMAAHERNWKAQEAASYKKEVAAKAAREKAGPFIARKDDWIRPEWHMSAHSYIQVHRATLPERGCEGGELFDDDDYMRWFLKHNPQCAPEKVVSGVPTSGWTMEDRLQRASEMGKVERAMEAAIACRRISDAASQKEGIVV